MGGVVEVKVVDLVVPAVELNPRLVPLGTGRPESGAGTEELRILPAASGITAEAETEVPAEF